MKAISDELHGELMGLLADDASGYAQTRLAMLRVALDIPEPPVSADQGWIPVSEGGMKSHELYLVGWEGDNAARENLWLGDRWQHSYDEPPTHYRKMPLPPSQTDKEER